MNAGGVDKACKSRGCAEHTVYKVESYKVHKKVETQNLLYKLYELYKLVTCALRAPPADEVVRNRYVPQSQAQLAERRGNS